MWQGPWQNPLPLIAAGLGTLLTIAAMFMPMARIAFGSHEDAPRDVKMGYFGYLDSGMSGEYPGGGQQGYLPFEWELAQTRLLIGIPLVILAVSATLALAASSRWVNFGRLASLGLGAVVAAQEFARINTWRSVLQSEFDSMRDERGDDGPDDDLLDEDPPDDGFEEPDESAGYDLVAEATVRFDAGMWVLTLGLIILAASVLLIRTHPTGPTVAYPVVSGPPPNGPQYAPPPHATVQQHAPSTPHPPAAPPTAQVPPQHHGPAGAPQPDGQPQVHVDPPSHDDPPSLSIFKPPPKDGA